MLLKTSNLGLHEFRTRFEGIPRPGIYFLEPPFLRPRRAAIPSLRLRIAQRSPLFIFVTKVLLTPYFLATLLCGPGSSRIPKAVTWLMRWPGDGESFRGL